MESNVLGYFLPNAILSEILSKFLTLEDVWELDVAICDKEQRLQFINCIKSEYCIWLGDKERSVSNHAISWIKIRSIKVKNLMCNRVIYNIAVEIGEFGSCLSWLSIKDKLMVDKSVAKIAKGCPNLKSLELSGCNKLTDKSVEVIAERCHHLETLVIYKCDNITDNFLKRIGKEHPDLQITQTKNVATGMVIVLVMMNYFFAGERIREEA